MENNHFTVVAPSGKEFVMKPLPLHFWRFYNQLPTFNAGKVAEEIQSGDGFTEAEAEMKKMTEAETIQMLEFQCDAVLMACVNPKISMKPDRSKGEISPFEIDDEDFQFLGIAAISGKDGEAERLKNFRAKENAVSGDDGAEIRAATEPVDTDSE